MTLTLTVLAPIFIAAGNYLLISRLILAVLPPSNHRILKIPGRRLTPIFVVCDIIAFLIQGSGSGIASSDNWTGPNEKIGRYVLIGGLAFQLVAFGLFLCVFRRSHVLANRKAIQNAPQGWRKVVRAVYISSGLIMVSAHGKRKMHADLDRFDASTVSASLPKVWTAMLSAQNGSFGFSNVCQ